MSIEVTLRAIYTPIGDIVCYKDNDPDYPSLYIELVTPAGMKVLLAVVEYNVEDKNIGICTYFDMSQDEPTYHDRITEEDIQTYLREVN